MPNSQNIDAASLALLNGNTRRVYVAFHGTSQHSVTLRRVVDYSLLRLLPPTLAQIVGMGVSSQIISQTVTGQGQVAATAGFIVRGGTAGGPGENSYDANSTGAVICPASRLTFTGDLGANDLLATGLTLNGRQSAAYNWAPVAEPDNPWQYSRMRAREIYLNTPGAINHRIMHQVVTMPGGTPAVNSGYTNVAPTAAGSAVNPFAASDWTPGLDWPGYADGEHRLRAEANNANESLAGSHWTPIRGVFELVNIANVRPKGLSIDVMGKGGTNTTHRLAQASQDALASYYGLRIDPDTEEAVIFIDGEHNQDVAHVTAGEYNAAYTTAVAAEMNRHRLAIATACPWVRRTHMVRVVSWYYVAAANGMNTLPLVLSCENRVIDAMGQVPGMGMISLAGLHNYVSPATNDLHLTDGSGNTPEQGLAVASLWLAEMQAAAARARSRAYGSGSGLRLSLT